MPPTDDPDRIAVLLRGDRPTPDAIAEAFGGRADLATVRVEQYPRGWVVTAIRKNVYAAPLTL